MTWLFLGTLQLHLWRLTYVDSISCQRVGSGQCQVLINAPSSDMEVVSKKRKAGVVQTQNPIWSGTLRLIAKVTLSSYIYRQRFLHSCMDTVFIHSFIVNNHFILVRDTAVDPEAIPGTLGTRWENTKCTICDLQDYRPRPLQGTHNITRYARYYKVRPEQIRKTSIRTTNHTHYYKVHPQLQGTPTITRYAHNRKG